MNTRSFVVAAILVALTGCSSMSKDAKNLMEKGDFVDAVAMWDEVLKKEPANEEAQRLRKVAQGELLNVDLVTLKGLLDSHQTPLAFDHLKKINDNRKAWNLGISPNSALYLKQQIERLYGQYLEMVNQELKLEHPLKALYIEKHFRDVLPTEIAPEEKLATETRLHQGVLQCDALETNSRSNENLRLYAIAFCKTFGKSVSLSAANQSKLREQLLKLPSITSKIEGLTPSDNDMIAHELSSTFSRDPQFSPLGTHESQITLGGKFDQTQTSAPISLSHSYFVQVPYDSNEVVTNYHSQPYTDSERHCNTDGTCWTESVTKYHDVAEYSSVTVTRLRPEPRVYSFTGTELEQKVHLSVQSNLKSSPLSLGLPYQDGFKEDVITHHEDLPAIGLVPKPGNLKYRGVWLKETLPKLSAALDNQLQAVWLQKHCAPSAKLKDWQLADHVFECFRSTRAGGESLVTNWFLAKTGLSPENTIEIIGPLGYL